MIVQKTIPFGDQERLRDLLQATADHLGGVCRFRKDGTATLSLGAPFALHPNTVRTSIRIRPSPGMIELTGSALPLPWTSGKTRRILEFRLIQVVEVLQSVARKEPPPPAMVAPFSTVAAGRPFSGFIFFLTWGMLSSIAGFAATLLFAWLMGLTLMSGVVGGLMAKGRLVLDLGGTPLPNLIELSAIDPGGPALLFALPIAFGIALVIVLTLFLGELFASVGRLALPAVLFGILMLLVALIPVAHPAAAVGFSLVIPLAAFLGYTFVWGRKGEIRNEPGRRSAKVWPIVLGGATLLLIVVGVLLRAVPIEGEFSDDVALFRDRVLLGNPMGKSVVDFYYRNTMYPAEIIKPLARRTNVCLVTDMRSPLLQQWFSRRGFYVEEAAGARQAVERFQSRPFDLLLISGTDEALGLLEEKGLERRAIIVRAPPTIKWLDQAFEVCSRDLHQGANLAGLARFGWTAVHLGLPVILIAVILSIIGTAMVIIFRLPPLKAAIAAAIVIALSVIVCREVALVGPGDDAFIETIRHLPKKDPRNVTALIDYLRHRFANVRYEAAYRIYQTSYGDRRYVEPLLAAMRDDDPRVRMWAALTLGIIGDGRALNPLIEMLEKDPEPLVRCKAAEALGGFESPEAVAALQTRMKSDLWYVGWYCHQSLRKIAKNKFIPEGT